MARIKRLPDAEFAIMDYVWDETPPVTTAMVWERTGREKGIKIQTVATLMGRLAEAGFLGYEYGKGRERFFRPLISRMEYLSMETRNFLRHYHRNSKASLLNALHDEPLTREDIDEMARWLREAERELPREGQDG